MNQTISLLIFSVARAIIYRDLYPQDPTERRLRAEERAINERIREEDRATNERIRAEDYATNERIKQNKARDNAEHKATGACIIS